jgi:hypothetical protein
MGTSVPPVITAARRQIFVTQHVSICRAAKACGVEDDFQSKDKVIWWVVVTQSVPKSLIAADPMHHSLIMHTVVGRHCISY